MAAATAAAAAAAYWRSFALLLLLHALQVWARDDLRAYGPTTAFTSRYWDCCKTSCSWSDKGPFKNNVPIQACDINNKPLMDTRQGTGCNGGTAFLCANQSPWAVNDTFSYGFVGAYMKSNLETDWCCSCYHLTFTTGSVAGKTMIVQAHNTDYDLPNENVFTFAIPGGNTSYAGACAIQYKVPNSTFGVENVGLSNLDQCENLPDLLQPGCRWRFDWFKDAQAPMVEYKRVPCPKQLTDITGCVRTDEDTFMAEAAKVTNTTKTSATSGHLKASRATTLLWTLSTTVFVTLNVLL